MAIDLHMHTTWSDGSLTPAELVEECIHVGLSAIAITDHDEVGGIDPALDFSLAREIKIVPGVELSIDYPLENPFGHLHVLGLFIDHHAPALNQSLNFLKSKRNERALSMIEKLRKNRIQISIEAIHKIAGEGTIGRPHIAQYLIEQKYAANHFEVFNQFLGKGNIGYVAKTKLKFEEASHIIHQSGGLAVLAHPISLGFKNYQELGKEILKLKAMGLDGVEVWYPNHDRYFSHWLADFSKSEKLAITGGSDFHGKHKPHIKPGSGRGNLVVADSVYANLKTWTI
jgi:predicted metal-dependent phosphoesterase TrpH